MKYTDRELEDILNKLIASTRSPRGRFSAASSYPQLEKKLNFRNRRLYLTRTFAAAAAVVLHLSIGMDSLSVHAAGNHTDC